MWREYSIKTEVIGSLLTQFDNRYCTTNGHDDGEAKVLFKDIKKIPRYSVEQTIDKYIYQCYAKVMDRPKTGKID
jgi:hypothetical protein